MDLVYEQVSHETFGLGQVTAQSQGAVCVRFEGPVGEKKFLYPSAFIKYLRLLDGSRQAALEAEIAQAQAAQAAEAQRKQAILEQQEALRQQRLEAERQIIAQHKLEQKQAAAKKRHAAAQSRKQA